MTWFLTSYTTHYFSNVSTVKSKFNYAWKRPTKLYGSLFTQRSSNLVPALLCRNLISQVILNLPSGFYFLSSQGREKGTFRLCIDVAILLFFMRLQNETGTVDTFNVNLTKEILWFLFSQILLPSRGLCGKTQGIALYLIGGDCRRKLLFTSTFH